MDDGRPHLVQCIGGVTLADLKFCIPEISNDSPPLRRELPDTFVWDCGRKRKNLVFRVRRGDCRIVFIFVLGLTDIFVQNNFIRFVNAVNCIISKVLNRRLCEVGNSSF